MTSPPAPIASSPRVIRVFVSSTFRDMHAERDELARRVFPVLRKRCEERGVIWSDVDLRWGIPEEKTAKVLSICFDEISRCRPFFIGLLGDRYGSDPESVPDDLLARESWLNDHRGASVTELEIRHGVLRHPELAPYARFYYRDPASVESLPDEQKASRVETASRRSQLEHLKHDIRRSGAPVYENYRNASQLGECVLRDFGTIIDRLFPEGSQPSPMARETAQHEWFARSRVPVELRPGYFAGAYVGRSDAADRLSAHARGHGPPLAVVGDSGVGKTSFLANWAFQYRERHPDDFVLLHFVGATPDSTDWAAMVRRLAGELQARFGIEDAVPDDEAELRVAFGRLLNRAGELGHTVLSIDGVDQLEDRNGAPDLVWLPRHIPAAVRIVLSSRQGRTADEIERRGWPTLDLHPLEPPDCRILVQKYLAQWGKELSPARVDRVIAAEQTANPLFLSTLLNELRLFGEHEELDHCIGEYLAAPTIERLFETVLQRLQGDYEHERPGLVGEALSLLGSSRRGLTESELLDLLGTGEAPLPHAYWTPLHLAIEPFLVRRSGRLMFSQDAFRQAAWRKYQEDQRVRRSLHERLAHYFDRRELSGRKFEELPWQLAQAGAWQRLYDLLADREFFFVGWSLNRFDMKAHWARLEENSAFRMADAYAPIIEAATADSGDRSVGEIFHIRNVADLMAGAGYHEQALVLRRYLRDYHREVGEPLLFAMFLNDVAMSCLALGRTEEALAALQEKRKIEHEAGADLQPSHQTIKTLNQLGMTLTNLGRLDEAGEVLEEEERLARAAADQSALGACLGNQARLLTLRGRLAEAIGLFETQEQICRAEGDLDGLKHALGNLGLVLAATGDTDRAEALLVEKERICRRMGDAEGLAQALGGRALIQAKRGEVDGATKLLAEQELICTRGGTKDGLAVCLGIQAVIAAQRDDRQAALALLGRQERLCREMGHLLMLQDCLGRQAALLYEAGDPSGAMMPLKERERICRQLALAHDLATTLGLRGALLQEQGDLGQALESFREQERLGSESSDAAMVAQALSGQARILNDSEEFDQALALYRRAAEASRAAGDLESLRNALADQADILTEQGALDDALGLLQELEGLCRRIGHKRGLAHSLDNQGTILRVNGDVDGALAKHEEAVALLRDLGEQADLAGSLGNRGVALREKGDTVAAMESYVEAEAVWRRIGDRAGLQRLLGNRGNLLLVCGDLEGALRLFEERAEICRGIGDEGGLQKALMMQRMVLARLGRA